MNAGWRYPKGEEEAEILLHLLCVIYEVMKLALGIKILVNI